MISNSAIPRAGWRFGLDQAPKGISPASRSSLPSSCVDARITERERGIRRGWDSNPRAGYPTRRFRGAPVTTTSVPLRERDFKEADLSLYARPRQPQSTALPLLSEKCLHQRAAFVLAHAAEDLEPMIVARQIAGAQGGHDRARPRFGGAVDERANARVHQRSNAHQARLDRHTQRRARQAVVADGTRGRANRHDLGVGGRIARADRLIEPAADDRA